VFSVQKFCDDYSQERRSNHGEQLSEYPGLQTGDEPRPMMLFDLANDPGEQHDVSAQHPDVVRRLKCLYDSLK
jgi:hypothetical protein